MAPCSNDRPRRSHAAVERRRGRSRRSRPAARSARKISRRSRRSGCLAWGRCLWLRRSAPPGRGVSIGHATSTRTTGGTSAGSRRWTRIRTGRLHFDGLATVADVWLNGTHILRSESMFVASAVGVRGLLGADNTLTIRFHALAPLLASKRPRPRWRTRLVVPPTAPLAPHHASRTHARLVSAGGAGRTLAPDSTRARARDPR